MLGCSESAIGSQQTKAPSALSNVGCCLDPWLPLVFSHSESHLGFDRFPAERSTFGEETTLQPPIDRVVVVHVYYSRFRCHLAVHVWEFSEDENVCTERSSVKSDFLLFWADKFSICSESVSVKQTETARPQSIPSRRLTEYRRSCLLTCAHSME